MNRLMSNASGLPTMPLITPGKPEESYLWRKVMVITVMSAA